MQHCRWVASVVLAASALSAAIARADEPPSVVAVLPLEAADEHLGIYSKPVADAVAKELREETSLAVESLSLSEGAPARVSLVVDGRIVAAGKRKVKLEARVRDPLRGKTIARSLATSSAPLGEIDELARALAADLAPRLSQAVAEQQRTRAAESRAVAAPAGTTPQSLPAASELGEAAAPTAPVDRRPGVLVVRAGGAASRQKPAVAAIATRAADWLAERLGYRPVRGEGQGTAGIAGVRAELARSGLPYAILLDVRALDYKWRGRVLSARGRVRVVLIDSKGRKLFDRTARTGTQVGSRGDGPAALVHYVAIQAIDIVTPYVKRALER